VTDSGPVLRVIRGDATPEEIAAVVAVLLARSAASDASSSSARPLPSAWADRSRLLRRPVHAGPGAWRRSGLPGA
jgi:hypothetical protein